jgi:dTDP-4-amino-4,6-dideoxy-D-galactose acyltransferase
MDFRPVSPSVETSLCRRLEWDSEFFQKRIARATPEHVSTESLREIRAWCAANRIDCLYLLAAADDAHTVRELEDSGFHFVDIRTTLETRLKDLRPKTVGFREARPDDVPTLRAIAGVSYLDSRFYNDGHFPEERCRALYETWIEKSVNGWAQAVLVAEWADEPVGYITCHLSPSVAEIGLLGVSAKVQGKGLGSQLIWESLSWFKDRGANEVTVVTQGRNVRAQRVYQKAGFCTRSLQLWYHYWPSVDSR